MEDQIKRFIAGLVEELTEKQHDKELEAWDFVAQKCGYGSHDEMIAAGRNARLDFMTRQIKLLKTV